jgi:hypothetical protein
LRELNGVTVERRISLISAGLADGFAAAIRATTPDTIGAAIEVPSIYS